jgi:hypothetical protein
MAKTYRITIEYTTTSRLASGPDYWDWPELLDLNPATETFGVWVDKVETNQNHIQYINEQNTFAEDN